MPRGRENSGLQPEQIEFEDLRLCISIVRHYTRETGVRNLERADHEHLPKTGAPHAGRQEIPRLVVTAATWSSNFWVRRSINSKRKSKSA